MYPLQKLREDCPAAHLEDLADDTRYTPEYQELYA